MGVPGAGSWSPGWPKIHKMILLMICHARKASTRMMSFLLLEGVKWKQFRCATSSECIWLPSRAPSPAPPPPPEHVASFYLDAYSRPEDKRGGAWMGVCLGASKALERSPVAYLTCNGSPPVGDTPSLMTFREVRAHGSGTGGGEGWRVGVLSVFRAMVNLLR